MKMRWDEKKQKKKKNTSSIEDDFICRNICQRSPFQFLDLTCSDKGLKLKRLTKPNIS